MTPCDTEKTFGYGGIKYYRRFIFIDKVSERISFIGNLESQVMLDLLVRPRQIEVNRFTPIRVEQVAGSMITNRGTNNF